MYLRIICIHTVYFKYIYTITQLNQEPFIPLIPTQNCTHAKCITILFLSVRDEYFFKILFFFYLRRRNVHTYYWLFIKKKFCDEFHIRIFECWFLSIKCFFSVLQLILHDIKLYKINLSSMIFDSFVRKQTLPKSCIPLVVVSTSTRN